ncbi:hypothetical protein ACFL6I_01270 [candidate division KSB1 bacterium]
MNRFFYTFFVLIVNLQFLSCDRLIDPGGQSSPALQHNYVAATAAFREAEGEYLYELVLIDVYDPENYLIATDGDVQAEQPMFSHDKSKIAFLNLNSSFVHSGIVTYYDLADNTLYPMYFEDFPVLGDFPIAWKHDDSGFYYYGYYNKTMFTDITSQQSVNVYDPGGNPMSLKSVIGTDTLVIFTASDIHIEDVTYESHGLYIWNIRSNTVSKIANPHLDYKAAHITDWNEELRLFAYTEYPELNIAVTDLHGDYYKRYTDSDMSDGYPRWGPDNDSIIFERHLPHGYGYSSIEIIESKRLMKIDLATGEVSELVPPENIGGAAALMFSF